MTVTQLINIEALRPVADVFESLGIEYYIGGSIASSYHGKGRSTLDIDIIAGIGSEHVAVMARLLESEYYADAAMIGEAVRNRRSFNLIHLATSYKIDVFVIGKRSFEQEARRRIVHGRVPGDETRLFPIASAEDVILNKLEWYRLGKEVSERQWLDVIGVMRMQADQLDNAYLDRWVTSLGVADLLERAREEVRSVHES